LLTKLLLDLLSFCGGLRKPLVEISLRVLEFADARLAGGDGVGELNLPITGVGAGVFELLLKLAGMLLGLLAPLVGLGGGLAGGLDTPLSVAAGRPHGLLQLGSAGFELTDALVALLDRFTQGIHMSSRVRRGGRELALELAGVL